MGVCENSVPVLIVYCWYKYYLRVKKVKVYVVLLVVKRKFENFQIYGNLEMLSGK